jgi:hypothetical protein
MTDKKSWLIYNSWASQIAMLSDEKAGKLFKALMAYNADGTEPDESEVGEGVYMAFCFMRPQIDENAEKYRDKCEKRSKAGSSGGRPRKESEKAIASSEKQKKQTKAKKAIAFSEKQTKAKKPDNDNENDNENDNDNDLRGYGMRGAPQADSEPAGIGLMLNDSTIYEVTQRQVERWKELYPAVEIMGELRKMSGWLEGNPTRRKTRSGILRFITSWLAKEQDKGGIRHAGGSVSGDRGQEFVIPGELRF